MMISARCGELFQRQLTQGKYHGCHERLKRIESGGGQPRWRIYVDFTAWIGGEWESVWRVRDDGGHQYAMKILRDPLPRKMHPASVPAIS